MALIVALVAIFIVPPLWSAWQTNEWNPLMQKWGGWFLPLAFPALVFVVSIPILLLFRWLRAGGGIDDLGGGGIGY